MSVTATALGALAFSTLLLIVMTVATGKLTTKTAAPNGVIPNRTDPLIDPKGPPVQFVLFSRNNPPLNVKLQELGKLKEANVDFNKSTKIIIHGFLSSIKQEVFTLTKDAYLSKGDYNIVGVDWSVLCEFEYISAMRGAQLAGKALAIFLSNINILGTNFEDIHIIGHSLGAHVAGIGADFIKDGRIARITGLDPAGPGYNEVSHNLRLDPGDAEIVDVIHTYMGVLSLMAPIGHVDFYPNGGRFQPGCPDFFDIWKVPQSIQCNHGRAYLLFVESILNNNAFKCKRCGTVNDAVDGRCFDDTDIYMGQEETYEVGIYYLKTNAQSPFSLT